MIVFAYYCLSNITWNMTDQTLFGTLLCQNCQIPIQRPISQNNCSINLELLSDNHSSAGSKMDSYRAKLVSAQLITHDEDL